MCHIHSEKKSLAECAEYPEIVRIFIVTTHHTNATSRQNKRIMCIGSTLVLYILDTRNYFFTRI